MKNLTSLLQLFDRQDYMEFCDDFSIVQSILNYCNEFIRPLQKIEYRGGNEPYINGIVAKFRQFLHTKSYYCTNDKKINRHHDQALRKITFFLILNTDMNLKYNLAEDKFVSHVINVAPQLSKFLLLCCIWELNLEVYFYECVALSPPWFALQLIENSVDSLKYAEPYEVIDRVSHMVTAIATNLARSDYRALGTVDKKLLLSKFYDYTTDFLRHFFTPDAEKLNTMSKQQFGIYLGHVMKHILNTIQKCSEIYEKKPIFELTNEQKIYLLMEEKEPSCDNHSTAYSEIVTETLYRIMMALLNSLQNNIMQITLTIFMDWTEEDFDDQQTLQSVVGNASYRLKMWLENNELINHDVVNQLDSISIKPLTSKEMASQATLGDIMNKLEKSDLDIDTRRIWVSEFIQRGELVLDNEECLDSLIDCVECLTVEHINDILVYAAKQDDAESIDDKLKRSLDESLNNFNENELKKLISFCASINVNDKIQLDNFENSLIESFNKATTSFYSKDTLKLMFQNPKSFFANLFNESLRNEQQLNNFIDFIVATPEISCIFIEDHLKELIDIRLLELPATEHVLVPPLILHIYMTDIIAKETIVSKILYKSVVGAVIESVYPKILILMKIFTMIGNKNDFGSLSAPVLAMAGQVLDHCRWDIIRYTEELENIVQKSVEFIQIVMNKFLPVAGDKEKMWILSKIVAFKPITRYYFQKLALSPSDTPRHFDEFLLEASGTDASDIVPYLCGLLVRCTKKESIWLAKNSNYLAKLPDVIASLSKVVARTTIENSINCFRHCAQCYIHILKKCILPNAADKILLFKQHIDLISKWSTISIYDELFLSFHYILWDILDEVSSETRKQHEELRVLIETLPECKSKTLFLYKFDALFKIES